MHLNLCNYVVFIFYLYDNNKHITQIFLLAVTISNTVMAMHIHFYIWLCMPNFEHILLYTQNYSIIKYVPQEAHYMCLVMRRDQLLQTENN